MADFPQCSFPATERSLGAAIKRDIHQLALGLPFSPRRLAELDIVVAELLSNLVKHAHQGELLVRPVGSRWGAVPVPGLELIALDNGPGMADPARMLQDGVSTTQTLGQGLGAINRLSDLFQLYSVVDWGTIVLCRIFTEKQPLFIPAPTTEIGTVVLPKPGETACGDGYAVVETAAHVKLFLGDGLGHGPLAETAVQRAVGAFRQSDALSPAALLTDIHKAVKGTRGLVGTVVVYDRAARIWQLCGVGNVSVRISHALGSTGYASHNGIIGSNIPSRLVDQSIAADAGEHVILYSDGLNNRWDINSYTSLFKYDPSVLVAALYKDQARRTDDVSVVVGRIYS